MPPRWRARSSSLRSRIRRAIGLFFPLPISRPASLSRIKPYKDAEYDVDAGFKKLATLKPNLLNAYIDAPQAINLLEKGEAQMIGGQFSAFTLIRKAAASPVDLALPRDGASS